MDGQDHKITATSVSAGHEGHGVHLCHRCGWPFPNPHPSAKHRRAHKRVCGTVEGYKISHSDGNDHHLADSDDDNASDDDEHHTPSPNVVKKNAASGVREGEKSATLEDDVFTDAVTDFSDSGTSSRLEERFESVRDSGLEQKSVEGDLHGSGTLEVKEVSDRIEESNGKSSEEISKHGPLGNGSIQPDDAVPITVTAAESVSVELTDDSQPQHGVGGSVHGEMIPGHDADFEMQEHGLASVTPEEGNVLDQTIVAAGESQDALHDTLVSAAAKHDPPPPCEPLQNLDASEVVNTVVHSAERIAPVDETGESMYVSVGVEEVSHSTVYIGSTESIGENISHEGSLVSSSEVKCNESTKTIDINEHSDTACMVSSIDKEEMSKASLDGGQTTGDLDASEEEKLSSVSTDNAFAFEDDTKITKEVVSHYGENINGIASGTGNEEGEGASMEVDVIPDHNLPSEKLTEFSSSDDAKSIQEPPENTSGSLEFEDDGLEKSIQSHGVDEVTEVLQSVGSAEAAPQVDHELSNKIHVARDFPETPEDSINATKDDNCIREDAKDHESNVEIREISESPAPSVQEAPLDVRPIHSNDDLSTSRSVDIIPCAKLAVDGKASTSDECSESANFQEFHGASDTVDKTNGEDVTGVDVKTALPELDDNSSKRTDDASAVDVSESLSSGSDSLEANCGSIVSETSTQKHRSLTEEVQPEKSDTFEPPSFMTLVQSGSEGDQATAATEIEAMQNNQQPKTDALQAGWFPSLSNVVNESEGRKKNEEMIAKVTNWSPVKQQHSPLKSLLSEVKSPNMHQPPAANPRVEAETKDDNAGATALSSVKASETPTAKDQDTSKHVEEWNSPARYPIEVKKEKKGRPFWVPFVCCSSTHRDL